MISDEPIIKKRGKLTVQQFWADLDTISQLWGFNSSNDGNNHQQKDTTKKLNKGMVYLFMDTNLYIFTEQKAIIN